MWWAEKVLTYFPLFFLAFISLSLSLSLVYATRLPLLPSTWSTSSLLSLPFSFLNSYQVFLHICGPSYPCPHVMPAVWASESNQSKSIMSHMCVAAFENESTPGFRLTLNLTFSLLLHLESIWFPSIGWTAFLLLTDLSNFCDRAGIILEWLCSVYVRKLGLTDTDFGYAMVTEGHRQKKPPVNIFLQFLQGHCVLHLDVKLLNITSDGNREKNFSSEGRIGEWQWNKVRIKCKILN